MAVFETHVTLAADAETVFDFLARPKNSEPLAPPGTTLQIIEAPETVGAGSFVTFDVSGFGPTQRFVHEIVEFDRPHRITERQEEGPFGSFHHETEFRSTGNGTVEVVDRIEYEAPSGLVGFLLTEKRIRGMLEDGYAHRHRELQSRFSKSQN